MARKLQTKLKVKHTQRGFAYVDLVDGYGNAGTIQKSSAIDPPSIWLGVDDPKISVFDQNGDGKWTDIELPEGALIQSRLHLTQEQVKQMLPFLQKFAETGELE